MTRRLIVTDSPRIAEAPGVRTLSPGEYLQGEDRDGRPVPRTPLCINLCRDFAARRNGYYVSLVASSRDQDVLPTVEQLEDLRYRSYYLRVLQEAGVPTPSLRVTPGTSRWVPRVEMEDANARRLSLVAVFGRVGHGGLAKLCREVWTCFPVPLLRIDLHRRTRGRDRRWKVTKLKPVAPGDLAESEIARLLRLLGQQAPRVPGGPRKRATYHWLACLWDADEQLQPSGVETLEKIERVATERNVHLDLISLGELSRLPEYDALFIRTTTGVDNRTFEFSKMARAFGMPVIDDPDSILRCSDKVFLFELFQRHGVPMPPTHVIQEQGHEERLRALGLPLILKSPGGSFSRSVKKAETHDQAIEVARAMFAETSLVVAQDFLPTDFDWRVGVLAGEPLYAARYFMAGGHWQVLQQGRGGRVKEGRVEAVPLGEAPQAVLEVALAATRRIGDGLYGVDLKEVGSGPVVIEVNDNPDLHVGYEDRAEGDAIYERIVDEFVRRIRASHRAQAR